MTILDEVCEVQRKASREGFEWDHVDQIFDKIQEESLELQKEVHSHNQMAIEEELGDFLFAAVGLARYLKLNPQEILKKAKAKFESRYSCMVKIAESKNLSFEKLSSEEKNILWEESKELLSTKGS